MKRTRHGWMHASLQNIDIVTLFFRVVAERLDVVVVLRGMLSAQVSTQQPGRKPTDAANEGSPLTSTTLWTDIKGRAPSRLRSLSAKLGLLWPRTRPPACPNPLREDGPRESEDNWVDMMLSLMVCRWRNALVAATTDATSANGRHMMFITGLMFSAAKIVWMRLAPNAATKYAWNAR